MVAKTLARVVEYPFEVVSNWISPLTKRVDTFVETYFKEIVFLCGTLVLAWKDPKASGVGALLGLCIPYSEDPSPVDEVNDEDKPFRVRYAGLVLAGAGFALLHEAHPAFRALRGLSTLGALGIGIGIKRFYLEVVAQ